ncbi:MAG: helix-turn-helix domain-containing protein [Defluviitaleaceae bacterium]|nr:helix-turn-helix domain-containing protein [Defluviitaleaceae bacterium]MCL2273412.1 helix-turn-helix domain-containing protein [Defluviitaleaceae bacterium]
MATFGERLQLLRQNKKQTQAQVAVVFNMSERAYRRYENGQSTPHHDTLIKLADFFDVSLDYLVGRDSHRRDADGGITVKATPADLLGEATT